MNTLIIGASRGLGRELAVVVARAGGHVTLVSSNAADLDALRSHLETTTTATASVLPCRLGTPSASETLGRLIDDNRTPDLVLFPIGFSSENDDGTLPAADVEYLLTVNFSSIVAIIARLWTRMNDGRPRSLVAFGSVAAIRGRGRNVVYSAAKRGLESYFESLHHRAVGTAIRVQFYQIGYLDTARNFGLRLLLPKADPRRIAEKVIKNSRSATFYYYAPWYWRLVAVALRLLPWAVYRKLRF